MHCGARGDPAGQLGDSDILHDHGIDAGGSHRSERAGCLGQFVVEDQGVKGEIAFDPAAVQRAQDGGQFVERKADLGAGGKMFEPEVDGVGTRFDRSVQLRPVPGWAHDFGLEGSFGGGHRTVPFV